MSFKKLLILSFVASLSIFNLHAENHDTEQNIIDKAKEINKKVKQKQVDQQANISSEIGKEEPLPLNDPFVGDASLAGNSTSLSGQVSQEELKNELSLYNFKLVGIMTGEYESYVSLINSSGEIMTLQLHEELSENVKLVAIKPQEAVFQKEDTSYLIINFKNQIRESLEAF